TSPTTPCCRRPPSLLADAFAGAIYRQQLLSSPEPVNIRNFPPPGKSLSEWHELCDHFTSEKHLACSLKNEANRAKLPQSSTQGSRSYAASRHEEWETTCVFLDLIEHYKKSHQ
nr:hypothetical protein [Tanacetum cinerariifolium]